MKAQPIICDWSERFTENCRSELVRHCESELPSTIECSQALNTVLQQYFLKLSHWNKSQFQKLYWWNLVLTCELNFEVENV